VYKRQADTLVTCGDSTEIQNVFDGGGSAEAWINLKSSGESNAGRIVTKGGWTFYQGSASGIGSKLRLYQFFSGVDGWWETDDVTIIFNIWHHVIVTYDNSAVTNNPILYVNGVKYSVGDGLTEQATPVGTRTTDVGTDLTIGGGVGSDGTTDGNILNAQLYDHVLTTKERNELYANFLASSQIGQPKRGFSLDKPKDLSDEIGLVAGYNMTLDEDGTGADLVGNALDITFSGGFLPTDNGIRFHGVDGKGVVGNVGNTKSMSFRIKLDSTTEKILEGAANDKLIHASSGTMTYPEFDNAFIDGIDSNAITAGQWTNVVIVSSTNVDMSAVTIALNNATYGDFEMADLRFYSTQLTLANAITLHNSFILPTLVETFDEGADGIAKLPREWIAGTGTYKISQVNQSDTLPTFPDGIKLYDKYLECTVAGTIATLSHQAFGTWEWDMYKLDASEVFVLFTASVVGNRTATGQDGYYLGSSNAENLILGKNTDGTPSALYVGANGIINASQWYHYKVTKIKPGVMSLLVDGVLVAASSGSNPVTDTSFSTSVFTVLDNDAGDRVANFNYKDEIEQ
jgi:hypothetical protein